MGLIPNGGEDGYELSCAQEHNTHNSLQVLKIPVIENLRSLLNYATDHPLMKSECPNPVQNQSYQAAVVQKS